MKTAHLPRKHSHSPLRGLKHSMHINFPYFIERYRLFEHFSFVSCFFGVSHTKMKLLLLLGLLVVQCSAILIDDVRRTWLAFLDSCSLPLEFSFRLCALMLHPFLPVTAGEQPFKTKMYELASLLFFLYARNDNIGFACDWGRTGHNPRDHRIAGHGRPWRHHVHPCQRQLYHQRGCGGGHLLLRAVVHTWQRLIT